MATRDDDLADDRNLASAVCRGKPGAAEMLFDRLFDWLYVRVCARLGGDHHTAEDIVSESLLAGLRGLKDFRGDASLRSWFLAIASRKIADLKRRRILRLVAHGDNGLEDLLGASRNGEETQLDRLADEELRREVTRALQSLPVRHRTVLEWKYFDESSLAEVAVRLQVSPKAAERRLARAREALASVLRGRNIENS